VKILYKDFSKNVKSFFVINRTKIEKVKKYSPSKVLGDNIVGTEKMEEIHFIIV